MNLLTNVENKTGLWSRNRDSRIIKTVILADTVTREPLGRCRTVAHVKFAAQLHQIGRRVGQEFVERDVVKSREVELLAVVVRAVAIEC